MSVQNYKLHKNSKHTTIEKNIVNGVFFTKSQKQHSSQKCLIQHHGKSKLCVYIIIPKSLQVILRK